MSRSDGPWVHLELSEEFFRAFEVPPVPMPIRVETLEAFTERKVELSMEVLATELLAYLEGRPAERPAYRAIFGELAMSVGAEAGKAGDPVKASKWLWMASEAITDDPRILLNYAVSLLESGRPAESLEVCARVRALAHEFRDAASLLLSIERKCRRALEDESHTVS